MSKRMAGVAAAIVLAFTLAGCTEGGGSTAVVGSGQEIVAVDITDLSGGVAADVGNVQIGENAITAYINNFRYGEGLQDDEKWGQWIFDAGYTMDSLRGDTVELFVNQELIRQAAAQEGVVVTDEEVDGKIAESRADATDEEYAAELDGQGLDEATYRENVRIGLLQQKLVEKVAGDNEVDDETLLKYLKLYYPDDVDQDATTLDGVDKDRIESVRELVANFSSNESFTDWIKTFRDKVGVLTYLMPDGLPYVVDLAPYEEAAYAEENGGSSTADVEVASSESEESSESSSGSSDEGASE